MIKKLLFSTALYCCVVSFSTVMAMESEGAEDQWACESAVQDGRQLFAQIKAELTRMSGVSVSPDVSSIVKPLNLRPLIMEDARKQFFAGLRQDLDCLGEQGVTVKQARRDLLAIETDLAQALTRLHCLNDFATWSNGLMGRLQCLVGFIQGAVKDLASDALDVVAEVVADGEKEGRE